MEPDKSRNFLWLALKVGGKKKEGKQKISSNEKK